MEGWEPSRAPNFRKPKAESYRSLIAIESRNGAQMFDC